MGFPWIQPVYQLSLQCSAMDMTKPSSDAMWAAAAAGERLAGASDAEILRDWARRQQK